MVKKTIFRYRVITNLNCNMNESTGPNGNCYFCYQPLKEPLQLNLDKAVETMNKVGVLRRASIMGGEATLRKDLPDIIKAVKEHVSEDVCLVTNGILLNEERAKAYSEAGLTEVAVSISSLEQYKRRREQILLCKKYIPNTRINIPTCNEAIGDNLIELLEAILCDGFYTVISEDMMGRYNDFEFPKKMGAVKVKDDGKNFFEYEWKDSNGEIHHFGLWGNYTGWEDTDIIITPFGNFCRWEDYCKKIGNYSLDKNYGKNDDIDFDSIKDLIDSQPIKEK